MWIPKIYPKHLDPLGSGSGRLRWSRSARFEPISATTAVILAGGAYAAAEASKPGDVKSRSTTPQLSKTMLGNIMLPALFDMNRSDIEELLGKRDKEGNLIRKKDGTAKGVPTGNKMIKRLIKGGHLDDYIDNLKPDTQVYEGERVAGFTDTQNALLSDSKDIGSRINTSGYNSSSRDFSPIGGRLDSVMSNRFGASEPRVQANVFDTGTSGGDLDVALPPDVIANPGGQAPLDNPNTLSTTPLSPPPAALPPGAEIVGEDGAEPITANQNIQILPNSGNLPTAPPGHPDAQATTLPAARPVRPSSQDSSIVTEGNQVGLTEEQLRASNSLFGPLPGRAEGGPVKEGETVIAGEAGPEVAIPSDTATRTAGFLQNEAAQLKNQEVSSPPNTNPQPGANPAMSAGFQANPAMSAGFQASPPAADPLKAATDQAVTRSLSGNPSTNINTSATESYIQDSIAAPARQNFKENTSQDINAASAGVGFFGTNRMREQSHASQNVEKNILAEGSKVRYNDEIARRGLAESAANRSLTAVNAGLNVQNNELTQGQMASNIDQTKANIAGTDANTAGTDANTAATESATTRQEALLPGEVAQQAANTDSTAANTAATDVNTVERAARIEGNLELQNQSVIAAQLGNVNTALVQAGLEQVQNQREIDADMQKLLEENQAAQAAWNNLISALNLESPDDTVVGGSNQAGAVADIVASTALLLDSGGDATNTGAQSNAGSTAVSTGPTTGNHVTVGSGAGTS